MVAYTDASVLDRIWYAVTARALASRTSWLAWAAKGLMMIVTPPRAMAHPSMALDLPAPQPARTTQSRARLAYNVVLACHGSPETASTENESTPRRAAIAFSSLFHSDPPGVMTLAPKLLDARRNRAHSFAKSALGPLPSAWQVDQGHAREVARGGGGVNFNRPS